MSTRASLHASLPVYAQNGNNVCAHLACALLCASCHVLTVFLRTRRRGAIHIGQLACSCLRHRIVPSGAPESARLQAAVLGTALGALGSLAPVWDALPGQALLALQKAMSLALPQPAGLNPASFRCGYDIWQSCLQ